MKNKNNWLEVAKLIVKIATYVLAVIGGTQAEAGINLLTSMI